MSITTIPLLWNSAHRPVEYRFTFTPIAFLNITDNGGFARLNVGAGFVGAFTVGQRVFITSGVSAGNWVVTEVSGTVTISAPFISSYFGGVIPLANVPVELWAGYDETHEGYADHPYRKIADILGVAGVDGFISFDVSGYLKGLFKKIESPRLGRDFRMSAPFDLRETVGIAGTPRYVLNGTFKQADLQSFDTDYAILNAREPIHFKDGVIVYSMINSDTLIYGEHIVNIMGVEGEGNVGGVGFDEIGSTFTVG